MIAVSPKKTLQNPAERNAIEPGFTGAFRGGGVAKAIKNEYRHLACELRQEIQAILATQVEVEQHDIRPVLLHGR